MSIQHHSPEESDAQRRMLAELLGNAQRRWPHKRISGDDDGETAFAIATDPQNEIIRIQFTKPMNWIGLDIQSAKNLHRLLGEKITELSLLSQK